DEARQAVAARLSQRVIGEPQLVWRPCRESASPFQPLYQVPIAGGEAFVSVDGSVYRSLTHFGKGGYGPSGFFPLIFPGGHSGFGKVQRSNRRLYEQGHVSR